MLIEKSNIAIIAFQCKCRTGRPNVRWALVSILGFLVKNLIRVVVKMQPICWQLLKLLFGYVFHYG